MRSRVILTITLLLGLGLAGCGGPDAEFVIGETGATPPATTASQVPLYIPPEYALRPGVEPADPVPRPVPPTGLSAGESRLLTLAGAAKADPRIRAQRDGLRTRGRQGFGERLQASRQGLLADEDFKRFFRSGAERHSDTRRFSLTQRRGIARGQIDRR